MMEDSMADLDCKSHAVFSPLSNAGSDGSLAGFQRREIEAGRHGRRYGHQ
jgi:hypothetical protein